MSAVADDVLRFVEYNVGEPSVVKKISFVCMRVHVEAG